MKYLFFLVCFTLEASVEVKGGYFVFADAKMRSVYNKGGVDVQLSGSFPCWRNFKFYTSVEYLRREGRSLGECQKTAIWQVPVSVGLKASAKVTECLTSYAAVGPRYFYAKVRNNSCFVDRNLSKNGVGGFVTAGFTFAPGSPVFIDLFGQYAYQKAQFHPSKANVCGRNIQVGGFVVGGGLGYKF